MAILSKVKDDFLQIRYYLSKTSPQSLVAWKSAVLEKKSAPPRRGTEEFIGACWWCLKHAGIANIDDVLLKDCPEEFKSHCRAVDNETSLGLLASVERTME